VGFQLSLGFLLTLSDRITVRQTIDPYADNIQYIASRAVALEPDGRLCLSTIGLGKPGNNFFVRHSKFGHIFEVNP